MLRRRAMAAPRALKLLWNKEFIFFLQHISVIEFEAEPSGMLEIGLVQDEEGISDVCQFEQQFVGFIEEPDGIMSFDGFGQGHMDITVFTGKHVVRHLVNFYGDERFDEEGVSIDENDGIPGISEQGVAEG